MRSQSLAPQVPANYPTPVGAASVRLRLTKTMAKTTTKTV